MAKAIKTEEREIVIHTTVELKLSMDEADTLVAVLALVSGTRKESPREHVVSILDALRRAGVRHPSDERGTPGSVLTWQTLTAVPDVPYRMADLARGTVLFEDYPNGGKRG